MKKLMTFGLVLMGILVLPMQVVNAGQIHNAKVLQVRVDPEGGYAMILFDQDSVNTPECVNPVYINQMAIDLNWPGGKAAVATFILAKSTNQTVSAIGNQVCTMYGGMVENLSGAYLK